MNLKELKKQFQYIVQAGILYKLINVSQDGIMSFHNKEHDVKLHYGIYDLKQNPNIIILKEIKEIDSFHFDFLQLLNKIKSFKGTISYKKAVEDEFVDIKKVIIDENLNYFTLILENDSQCVFDGNYISNSTKFSFIDNRVTIKISDLKRYTIQFKPPQTTEIVLK